jgi:hypothetical protein
VNPRPCGGPGPLGDQDICRGADKSLARPTSRCILFDGENISFDANLVMYMSKGLPQEAEVAQGVPGKV